MAKPGSLKIERDRLRHDIEQLEKENTKLQDELAKQAKEFEQVENPPAKKGFDNRFWEERGYFAWRTVATRSGTGLSDWRDVQ